jgi:hypothetical protein
MNALPPDPLVRCAEVMRADGGVISRRRALAEGLSSAQVETLLRRGTWWAVRRGLYADLRTDDVGAGHALAVAARTRALRRRHAASHRSAALVLGIPLLGPAPVFPQLVRASERGGDVAKAPGLHVARLDDDEVFLCRGVLVTTPARTVCDIARTRPFREAVVVADAVLHAGVPRAELERMAMRCAAWPGAQAMARVLAFADERAESPLESLDRVAFAEFGLPRPRTQVDIYGPRGQWLARVDFLFEAERTVVEPDGLAKYRLAAKDLVPDWVDDALVKEKQRETTLRHRALEVLRNGWDEAFRRPGDLSARVREHFGFAARYPAVPGIRFDEAPVKRRTPLAWPLTSSSRTTARG